MVKVPVSLHAGRQVSNSRTQNTSSQWGRQAIPQQKHSSCYPFASLFCGTDNPHARCVACARPQPAHSRETGKHSTGSSPIRWPTEWVGVSQAHLFQTVGTRNQCLRS